MRLIIVSNRAPVSVSVKDGAIKVKRSPGGLATGISSYLEKSHSVDEERYLWIGWPGGVIDQSLRCRVEEQLLREHAVHPVFLSEENVSGYYEGLCNESIWPLFHYFPTYASYYESNWRQYERVNELFCRAVIEKASPDDVIWVHDYHLMLLPALIRSELPEAKIGFFLHIPFPSFEIFRLLPRRWRTGILEGLTAADLIGFHTQEYTQSFLRCVLKISGFEHNLGEIACDGRIAKADTFPMGIDYAAYASLADRPAVQRRHRILKESLGSAKVVLSIDRLDYTKGIADRLRGFMAFLERNPHWHDRVVLVMVVVPSRTRVGTYRNMKREIENLVGQINGRFGHLGWTPILYQYRSLSKSELTANYLLGDVALVTPKRDGMNLIAKEYLAARTDGTGVLILSETAGAARELGEAILVNPGHIEDISESLEQALDMPISEQEYRVETMQKRLQRYDVTRWAEDFLESLAKVKEAQHLLRDKFMSTESIRSMTDDFEAARRIMLALDYDGTLVPLDRSPELAQPTPTAYQLLRTLSEQPGTSVAVVSGRDRESLDGWFGDMQISIVAEHGAWKKKEGSTWESAPVSMEWKEAILPLLERYVDRLPGSFIESKDFSLAWHYRQAEPELGSVRAMELMDDLIEYTANMNLHVLQGSKVIEVRHSGVDKGRAVMDIVGSEEFDFILAIGDDWTDEDLFEALPETAYTVRVGTAPSCARFHLEKQSDVISLLEKLAPK